MWYNSHHDSWFTTHPNCPWFLWHDDHDNCQHNDHHNCHDNCHHNSKPTLTALGSNSCPSYSQSPPCGFSDNLSKHQNSNDCHSFKPFKILEFKWVSDNLSKHQNSNGDSFKRFTILKFKWFFKAFQKYQNSNDCDSFKHFKILALQWFFKSQMQMAILLKNYENEDSKHLCR